MRESGKYWIILPLSLIAIGAFFLDAAANLGLFVFLLLFTAVFHGGILKKSLKNLFYLFLFTLPVLAMKIAMGREGMSYTLFWWVIYADGLVQALESLARILVLAMVSILAVRFIMEAESGKAGRTALVSSVFQSIELYQKLLGGAVTYFRGGKKGKGFLDYIDSMYRADRPED